MCDKRFCVPVLTAILLGVVILLFRFSPEILASPKWQLCAVGSCNLQSWISALGGVVGATVAAFAIIPLLRQLGEQRKQTAFLLGDGEPTIEMFKAAGRRNGPEIRIVNWNRRTLVLTNIRMVAKFPALPPTFISYLSSAEPRRRIFRELPPDGSGKIRRRRKVEGWMDRQSAPPCFRFFLSFAERGEQNPQQTIPTGENFVEIIVEGFKVGEAHDPFTIRMKVPAEDIIYRGRVTMNLDNPPTHVTQVSTQAMSRNS